jgi:hypothetical protein
MKPAIDRDISKLPEPFQTKVRMFLGRCPQIFVTEALRSAELQNWYYKNKPGSTTKDGYNNLSQHQKGLAIDIAFHGAELYPKNFQAWREVANIAKDCGLDWGYDLWYLKYNFDDKPHFQDNGQPINNKSMDKDFISLCDEYVGNSTIWTDKNSYSGENTMSRGQIMAAIDLAAWKNRQKIAEEIADKVFEKILQKLTN